MPSNGPFFGPSPFFVVTLPLLLPFAIALPHGLQNRPVNSSAVCRPALTESNETSLCSEYINYPTSWSIDIRQAEQASLRSKTEASRTAARSHDGLRFFAWVAASCTLTGLWRLRNAVEA